MKFLDPIHRHFSLYISKGPKQAHDTNETKTMNRTIVFTTGLALVLITGCVVTSVYPFYLEKDVVFEPALLGDWQKVGQPDEQWQFARDQANGYRITCVTKDSTNVLQGHVFVLQGEKLLDLTATEWKEDIQPMPVPSHLLVRLGPITPTLEMASLSYQWLGELVAKNPKAIRHILVPTGDKPEDRRVVLTADTLKLQQFVIKHLKTEGAWEDAMKLQRVSTEPPPR